MAKGNSEHSSTAQSGGIEQKPLSHIAFIMDGNNRWAKARGEPGLNGHWAGVERVRDMVEACIDHHISVLTLFAFSSENWLRPADEVSGLMELFATYIRQEADELNEKGVCIRVIGERSRFRAGLQQRITDAEQLTAGNGVLTLVLAVDYGGRWDIVEACRDLASQACKGELQLGDIDEQTFDQALSTAGLVPPDMCVRTAGEQRISNFLLWQLAYSELYFADQYWPDFDRDAFDLAVADYYRRQRRFGLSQDQTSAGRQDSA